MCGIAGELTFDGSAVEAPSIKRMTDALRHRGPDDEGMYCDGPVGFGHRRLSIIDLSAAGRQPMRTPDGRFTIVFNGEVYNYPVLRVQLLREGYRFGSESDAEVVLAAVALWGLERALRSFIGMFAFAVWDASERVLSLCRDRAGIKPLHYFHDGTRLLFASELKGMHAHPGFVRRVRPASVAQFLSVGYILSPCTIYENTWKVPAAHYARITGSGAVTLHKYWGVEDIRRGAFTGTLADAAAELDELATSAFRYRLVSDVPVGVFLSGGIDSSYLAAVLKSKIGADLLHLTIGFKDAAFDESGKASQVARALGLRHEIRYLDANEGRNLLDRFISVYDEPFSDTSGLPTMMVASVAREYVKVVLSADGGDEQFGGYDSYFDYARKYDVIKAVPRLARRAAAGLLRALPVSNAISLFARLWDKQAKPQVVAKYEKGLDLLGVNSVGDVLRLMNEKAWPPYMVPDLMRSGTAGAEPLGGTVLAREYPAGSRADLIDTMLRTDYRVFMSDDVLAKVDRASMSWSLEVRDPLIDHRITEFACALPLEFLFGGGEQKHILRHLLRQWIGEEVVSAPKQGFTIPLYQWLRGPWRPLIAEHLSKERIRAVGLLDERAVEREIAAFYARPGRRSERVMVLLLLQMWAGRWNA